MKGPAVWLDMDQAELDAAYDQSKYAANQMQIRERCATNSEAVRARYTLSLHDALPIYRKSVV